NVIAANGDWGIQFGNSGQPAGTLNVIERNFIGTNVALSSTLGNGGSGVRIDGYWSDYTVADNVIAYNGVFGVENGSPLDGRSIPRNSIFGNASGGIANTNAAPVLTSVVSYAAGTIISGTVAGSPNAALHIEFFSNPSGVPSQGQTYLGFADVKTDPAGNF